MPFYGSLLKLHRNRHFRSDGKLGFHGTGCPSGAYHAPGTAAFADHPHLYHHFSLNFLGEGIGDAFNPKKTRG